jgi:hypothetical protein
VVGFDLLPPCPVFLPTNKYSNRVDLDPIVRRYSSNMFAVVSNCAN